MARYKYNDKLYDIPEEVVDKFESMYPDAVTRFSVEDDVYEIPVSRKRDFLGTFKNATPYEDFSSLDNPERDNDFDDTDYVSQSSQNPPPIALRQEFDVTKPDQSEYVNPLTNSPDYNFESLRKKGKIETVKPNDKFGLISESINENRIGLDDEISNAMRGNVPEGIRPIDVTTNLISARNYLNEADDLIKARKEGGGVLRGMRDAASKLGTWDFGTSDLAANKSVYNALRKFESGEELSQDEQRLLDAVAVNTAAKVYASDLGVSYDIGSGFVQSIPFMLEMIVNPLSGAGKGVGKALAGYAAKRFGGKVIPKVAGAAGRVVGDIAASTGMAATTGAAGVAADTYSRMIGSPVYTDVGRVSLGQEVRDLDTGEVLRDENGNPVKVGSVGKESIGSALYKSLASRSIDNFSEMFGSYFGPVGDILKETKAGKKISASALVNSMNKLTTADWTKGFNKIMQDAKYDGFFGETAEEYVGGLLNAAIVGDRSLEDLGSLDNLLQTAGTVGLMSGILGSVNLIGLRGVRYNARKGLERSEANGRKVFGDDFDVLKDELMNMDPDQRKDVVRDMIASDRFNMEQKKAIMDYFYRRSVYDGLANGESKKMDEATQAETEAIESESNPETGLYIEASRVDPLTKQLTPGTIVQGMMEDGKDRVMWKGPDGKVEMILKSEIDPSSVRSMETQEIIDVSVNNIRESMRAEIERDSKYDPSIPSPEETIGQSFYVDGNPYAFFNENGRLNPYLVDLNGKPIKPVRNISVEDYYQAKQAEIDKQKVVQNSPVYKLSDGRIARLIDMDESDVALEILDRDGNPVGNISMTKEDFDNNASMQEQSPYERYVDTGDVDDSVVNLIADKISRGDALTPEEESMRQGASDRVESRLSDIRDQSLKEAETLNVTESISQSSNQWSEVPLDNQEPTGDIKPSVVMKEDGTPNFVSSGVDATLDFLYDKYGDKMPRKIEVTRKAFDEDLKKASEKLDKAQEAYDNAPIGKEDKVEAALIKARQEYDAIKVEADFWANLDDDIKEASKKPGDVIAKEISVMGDPMSGEELAAMMLANGAIKLTRDTYKKETGAGNNETARMFGLFASPEKGGVNIERAGEILELADRENGTNFFDENDTNAGRDAIIEVLSSAHTRGDLIDYVKRNREAIAERERQAEYNAYAEWCEENYHMSPEEYEAYEDDLRKQAEIVTEETIEYVNGEIADEIQAIINEQSEIDAILAQNNESNEEIERNDEGGTGGLLEGGDQLLQGEQTIQAGRVGEIKQGHTGVDGRVDRTDGAAQEGASIIDKIRYSSPVEITGNEISPSEDLREYKKNALEYGKSLRGEYINKDSGKTIFLGKNAIKEVLHHDYKNVEQLQSIAAIPKIIENAIFVTSQENTDSKVNAESFDYYVCGLRIGDVDYTVRAVFVKPKDGDRYYDHKLTRIEKGKLIDSLFGTTPGFNQTTSLVSGSEDKKLISILQDKVFEKDAKEAKSFVAPSPKENENPLDYAERIVEAKRLHDEELKVDTNPSEAQKEAGNYKKGHIKINGFDVTIEQPAGSVRSGKDASGKEWSQVMNNTYGYIRGTEGVDGDHIDVFLGPDMNSDMVYVVDQVNTDGSFDEHKVMIGFSSLEDARSAYLSNYEDGWQGLGNITGVALDGFKKWIDSSTRKTKPFSEYKGIKREEDIAPRKVKKLSLVDKDDYITSAERKHIKAFLESGLKEARVNNSIYEISNIGDDGVYEIVRRFNYTDPLTLVKDENGKLVNKRGEGEHVIRVKPTFEETRPDSGIRFRETRIIPEEENIIKKAKSDGSYMKAPNGNPTNLNEKQWVQVRTKAFKEWFGDWENNPEDASKVIDENGEPRVVYHGTYADFNAFDESHLGDVTNLNATNEDWAKTSHIGFWFNNNKIGFYTKHKPVFLNVRNPLEFASMESLVDEMSYYDSGEDFKRSNSDGYDSVIVLEDEEMGGRSYSVFNDNQIKSATENNGGFSSHNDDIRFREVKDKNGEKSLVGLHNISEEKLLKALRQGGFANPSAAVIDISRQSHTGYGSISLVLPSSMIEKRTGKNAGTWSQDAWTPIYPTIERQFSGKGSDAFSKDLQKLPEEMRSTTKSGMDSYMDGRGEDSLAYMYLYEQGKAPELARTKPSYPEKTRTEVEDATNGSFSMSGLSDKQLSRLKDAYMEYKGFSTEGYNEAIKLRRAKLEEAIGKMNPRSILYEKRKTDLERIDKYGFDYSAVESFMKSVRDDISNSDKVDAHGTMRDSWNFIEENGMRGDFNKWLDKLNERYGIKEIIFNGFTPSGIRKYIPNTLENVSKFMKKQGRSASVGIGASFQNFAASLLDAKGSLKDIRKDKGKLTTDHADVDAFRDKWSKVFHELGEKLQPDAKGYDDYGLYRLAEAARSKDPQKYIKEEYGIDFSDEDVKTLNEMVDAIRNEYPAMYFETKFERPVYLEEFAAAVVPDNVDGDIRKAIYDAGLKIFTYKADDEISRNEAVKQASEIDGVRFRSIGDKGADNLNKAETIESSINDWSNKLNTPVRVIHDVDDITDTDENMLARKRDSKGWYDTSTGEIVIVSPNSTSVGDAQRTFLHEVVGHHGLRELFGDDFDTFLDNVYRNANEDIRKNIIDRTKGNPLNLREATEEYLAELAERGFDNKADRSLWEKIKDAFLDMLRKAGISLDFKLSDNDLRYILWRSYKNLEQGNLMDVAEDTVMRNDLGIGDFSVRFREEEKEDINDLKKKNYRLNKKVDRLKDKIDELHSDSQLSEALKNELINEIQSRIDSKDASNINKEDLLSLLKQVKGAKTKADMEDKMLEVDRISNEIRIRSTQRRIDRLLALKTQDVNGKNMSIAKNVDDSTRRVFDFIRGSLSDIKISGYEQEMKDLRRRNRELTTLIEARGRMTEDTGLSGDDRRSASEDIVSFKKEMEDNKVRISELKNMAEDVRNAKANDLMGELEHMRKELEDKLNEAAEGKAVWSIEDSERKMALDILGISLDARDYEGAVNSINRDIMEKVRNNSSFYAAQMNRIRSMENPTEQKEARKNMKAGYNENKRRIRAEKRLLNETLRSRLEVLDNIESLLNDLVEGGRAALSRKTEEETYRRIDIVRNSIEDVADKPVDINNKDLGKMNWFKKFASSPLGSFDYMAQRVGRKFLNGDGYIYQRFVKGQEGTIAAENELAKNRDRFRKTFANKVNEIFNEDADSVLSDSNKRVEKSGVYIINTDTEGEYGRKIEIPMTKGEAMYVYMVWKMDDGRMKLEQQGFTDDSLLEIEDFIGENYKAFADWIQDDLLVNLRDRYNERYVDMYGTSMANIPNYAPLRINKNAVMNEVDLEEVRKGKKTLEEKANSLIKRTVNSKPIDLSTNGIEAVISHVRDMEEWYAFARVRRDLSWLLSSPTFRNKVNSNVNGHYVDFVDAAALASHSYHPDPDKYADEFFAKVNRGLVGANISFGLMTAAKQILSLPAFLGYSQSPKFMVAFTKNIGLGFTGRPYKWAMENMPMFYERVKDGNLGDEKLRDDGDNLGKIIESYLKIGMVPNKMIDAFTISVGAKSVYDYTYDKLRKGYERLSDDEAKRQALVDAEIFFNQTQQSGVETFLSPMQRSRTIINRMLTTYQNSNIGYVRRVMLSLYDLASLKDWPKLRSNYAERFKAEGMDDDTANQKAQSLLLNGARKQLFHFLLFGWGMNMLWDLGSSGFFGFFAGDDDEDEKYKDIVKFVTTPVKGVPAGNIINNLVDGYDINPVLFLDELQRAYNNIGSSIDDIGMDPLLAVDVLSNGSKLVGFDMERWGNIYLGMEGLIRNQGKEGYLLQDIMFLLNTPKSQRVKVAREMYKNEPFLDYAEKVSRAYRYTPMSNKWEYWVPGTDILTRSKLNKIKRNYVEDNMTPEQKAQDKERKEKEKEIRRIRELSIDKEAMERFVNK